MINQRLSSILIMSLAFGLLFYLYYPGFTDFTFIDDLANLSGIVSKPTDIEALKIEVFGNHSGPLGRPVSMFSFALQAWLQGEFSFVTGKKINLALHCLNGFFLFLLLMTLRKRLSMKEKDCLLLSLCWLFAPLWASSVLYVVQRMSELATCFMLLSLLSYSRARLDFIAKKTVRANVLFVFSGLFFFAGLFSKENAVVLLPMILVLEAFVFRAINWQLIKRYQSLLLVFILVSVFALFYSPAWDFIQNGYSSRDFSLHERLATQPRMLVLSAWQVLVPSMSFGLYYDDIVISKGFFADWKTVSCWLLLLVTISFIAFSFIKNKFTVPAFGLAWFLVGHSLESSFIALEMYFEHRSYFPSIGLLIFVFYWLDYGLKKLQIVNIKHSVVSLYIVFQCLCLGVLASIWSNQITFYLNAYNHHPDSTRANINVATFAATLGDSSVAESIYNENIKTKGIVNNIHRAVFYCGNSVDIPQRVKKLFAESIDELWDVDTVIRTGGSFEEMVELYILTQRCTRSDITWLADLILQTQEQLNRNTQPFMYRKFMDIEFLLQRYDNVLYYLSVWEHEIDPDYLMMRLYYMLNLPVEYHSDEFQQQVSTILEKIGKFDLTERQQKNLQILLSGEGIKWQ